MTKPEKIEVGTSTKTDYPVPMDVNLSKSALQIKTKCKDCIHFNRMAYPSYKQVCSSLGIIEDAKPCENFSPNPASIKFSDNKNIRNVSRALEELSERELSLLAVIFNQERRTRRYGFNFGQIVYFRLFGGEYLKNYVRARVMSADSRFVHIQGTDGYIASLHHKSVLTERQWNKRELEFLKTNKIHDPSIERFTRVPTKAQLDLQKIEKPLPLDLTTALAGQGVLNKRVSDAIVRTTHIDKLLSVRG